MAGGVNLYAYAGNNPVAFSDPFGLCPFWLDQIPCGDVTTGGLSPASATTASGAGGSEYGYTRTDPRTGTPKWHNGFDDEEALGQPIYAPADGVASAGFDPELSGKFVKLDLGNGATLGLAHLDRYGPGMSTVSAGGRKETLNKGVRVRKGDVLGYVGKTGNAFHSDRDAHVHITARVNGDSCDPRMFFAESGSTATCGGPF